MSPGLPRGTIKLKPEDFVVDEIPAYEPSGEGSHLYVRFKKTNLTTDEVVKAFARALRVERRDIGVAGLKDKVGVTTQWISVPAADASTDERVASVAIDGVEILERRRHANKLKTGHLRGNRFTVVVRDVDAARAGEVVAALTRIGERGVPNAFGEQRFGRDGDTHERARAWLTGKERAPSDPRLRRFHFSALQSAIFNAVLAHRVADGSWDVPLLGDLLKKEETGGIFVCTDVQLDRERARQGEVCPTGPIVGDRMRQPEADALDLEQRISLPLIEGIDLRRARSLGEGTRRPLRLRVADLSHSFLDSSLHEADSSALAGAPHAGCAMTVRFVLPKGAYATTVLSNAFSISDAGRLERSGERPDEREERQLATLTEEE
ncbi:MAG: tRNA pseudouridine(13) synthase TruD [Labilithrix sp.]|nr:tRNA pseudouridine(13) synthase TruD [Labilithrix sp.]